MKYAIVIESGKNNYSAYVPDFPGCVSVGESIEETIKNIKEAMEFHIEGLIEDGIPIPEPRSYAENIEITAE